MVIISFSECRGRVNILRQRAPLVTPASGLGYYRSIPGAEARLGPGLTLLAPTLTPPHLAIAHVSLLQVTIPLCPETTLPTHGPGHLAGPHTYT